MNAQPAPTSISPLDSTPDFNKVLLLHCSASSRKQWASLKTLFGGTFKIAALDQWDCGEAPPWPGHETFSLALEAEQALEIIDCLDGPVHLVGHSYGGGLALHIARRRPQKLQSLTLIEPSAFHFLRQGDKQDQVLFSEIHDVVQAVNESILTGERWRGAEVFVDYWNGVGSWAATSEKGRRSLSNRLAKIVLDFRALFVEATELRDFANLLVPTKLIRGSDSPGTSLRIVEMLASTLPFAEVEIIPGAGHMSPFSHRDQVDGLIAEHLLQHAYDRRVAA